ncbi:hypothetical protein JCM8097_002569 [Rhodosporidiobolus ruineniae]
MPRSSSLTHTPGELQHALSSSSNFAAPPSPHKPRALAKPSSFADLRLAKSRILKRFRGHKGEFDFGCAGEAEQEIEEEDDLAADATVHARLTSRRPPLPSSPPSFASLPARPAPYRFPLNAPPSEEELRRLAREKEEELAAEACLAYTMTHARKSSRSSSLAHLDTSALALGPALERLSLRRGSAASSHLAYDDDVDEDGRPRSGSLASSSSECSSRPRTNDSLPSFVGSASSTIDSNGSFPPSPVQSPTLKSRPTFQGVFQPVKVDADQVAHQLRAYSFI